MENKKQEDLDVISLINAVKNGIQSLFNRFLWLIKFSLKHFFVFLLFIVIFAGSFLGLYYVKKPVYKSEMVLSHTRVENDYCYQIIKNLDNAIDGKGNASLANLLSLNPEYAKDIVDIRY